MNTSHDKWNKLMGINGGCSLNSSMSKKRIGLNTGGSTDMPKKSLFGKADKRVGTMIESAKKKEKMLADGGPSKEHVYKIGSSPKKLGENGAGRLMYPSKDNAQKRQEASIGGDIQNAAMKAKAGAEDVGRKIKGGFEDFGNKFRSAFHFEKGGRAGCKKRK